MLLDWNTFGIIMGVISATGGLLIHIVDNRRKEDRDFVQTEIADVRVKLVDDVTVVRAEVQHVRNNHKSLDQSCAVKFDAHGADIIRLTEGQRSMTSTVAELKTEVRTGFSDMKRDSEKSHEAFTQMLRSESERSRDMIKSAAEVAAQNHSALVESFRELRKMSTVKDKP